MPSVSETLTTLGFIEMDVDRWTWKVPGEFNLSVVVDMTYPLPTFSLTMSTVNDIWPLIEHETDPHLALVSVRVLSKECRRAYDMLARVAGVAQQIREEGHT
jgi:hypothetical protein